LNRFLKVKGSAVYLPEQCVTSRTLDKQQGYVDGIIESKTGVVKRFYATHETASFMAHKAIVDALQDANMQLENMDCLIAASGTMEQAIPCNAAKILAQFKNNLSLAAFDVNMTCLSGLMALDLASSMLATGQYKNIVIVSSEIASVGLDWKDAEVGGLFGDGAVALVVSLGESKNTQVLASLFRTFPAGVELCEIRGGGSLYHPSKIEGDYRELGLFKMQGKALYRETTKIIAGFIDELLLQSNLKLQDIDWVVPHQASGLALTHLVKKLQIDPDKVVNLLADRGNQIAASIPSALHELLTTKPVKSGDIVLLIGTSAGLSLGAMVLKL